jgi:hypothetical protein
MCENAIPQGEIYTSQNYSGSSHIETSTILAPFQEKEKRVLVVTLKAQITVTDIYVSS